MNFKYIIYLMVILSGCEKAPLHIQVANQFMHSFENEITKKEKIQIFGKGGGMWGDIKKFSYCFDSNEKPSIEEARIKIVRIVEDLLEKVNADIKIRPFLHDYPFTSQNVLMQVAFVDKNRCFVDPPYIALVMLKKGILYYSFSSDKRWGFEDVYEESYDEALRIYHEQMCY